MSKKQRDLGVDDFINNSLREPDRYIHDPVHVIHTPQGEDPSFNESALFRMTDAGLVGRLAFFEKQLAFGRSRTERDEARAEMARTRAEQVRRRNKIYSAAVEQAFQAEDHSSTVAANDAEANWQRATRKEAA